MANIYEQRIDQSGLYIRASNQAEVYLTPDYCQALLVSCNNDMAAYDKAVKDYIVLTLGNTQISADEMLLTYGLNGLIKDLTTGVGPIQ